MRAVHIFFCLSVILMRATVSSYASERAIDQEVVVDATVDQVWDAWTTRAGIVSFFAPDAEIDPRVGGAFHIFFIPDGEAGMKGADTMVFLALQPKTMLSFDWNAPPPFPAIRAQRTFVVVRFADLGGKTRVTLHHTGWGSPDGADGAQWAAVFDYFDKAWGSVLASLQKRFAPGGGPRDWTEWLNQLKDPPK